MGSVTYPSVQPKTTKTQNKKRKNERETNKQTPKKQKTRACSQGVSREGETEVVKGKPNVHGSRIETPCPKPLHLEVPTTKLHLVIVSESSLYAYLSPFVLPEFLLSKLGSMYKKFPLKIMRIWYQSEVLERGGSVGLGKDRRTKEKST